MCVEWIYSIYSTQKYIECERLVADEDFPRTSFTQRVCRIILLCMKFDDSANLNGSRSAMPTQVEICLLGNQFMFLHESRLELKYVHKQIFSRGLIQFPENQQTARLNFSKLPMPRSTGDFSKGFPSFRKLSKLWMLFGLLDWIIDQLGISTVLHTLQKVFPRRPWQPSF